MRTAQDVIKQISGLSQKLTKVPPEQFIRDLPDELCTILEADACVLWQKDKDNFFILLSKSKQVS